MNPRRSDLAGALAAVADAILSDPAGDLPLPARRRIWAALGPLDPEGQVVPGIGRRRRTALAILCARSTLIFWEEVWPEDEQPQQALTLAEQGVRGTLDRGKAERYRDELWTAVDNRVGTGTDSAAFVGYAAANALHVALYDESFDPERIDGSETDGDLDPYEWDAAFYAAATFAGGLPWNGESSPEQRRRFWEWYLGEAVRNAWDLVTRLG